MKRLALPAALALCSLRLDPLMPCAISRARPANIIPSGQLGGVPVPKQADRQARMYDALTPLFDGVKPRDLTRYFKSEKLGIKGQGRMKRERVPRRGVRMFRDKFNVPHIYGKTNDDVTWGAGWALAQDRELLLEQARFNARVAVLDVPGMSALDLITAPEDLPAERPGRARAQQGVGKLRRYGKRGRQPHPRHARLRQGHQRVLPGEEQGPQALDHPRRDRPQRDQERALRRGRRRRGRRRGVPRRAGGRTRPRQGLLRLERPAPAPGPGDAVTIKGNFPTRHFGQPQRQRRHRQRLVRAVPVAGASAAAATRVPGHASNVLMVAGNRSRSGHPLFVGGPQIGYFYPGLTLEMDLHGPAGTRAARPPRLPRLHPDRAA